MQDLQLPNAVRPELKRITQNDVDPARFTEITHQLEAYSWMNVIVLEAYPRSDLKKRSNVGRMTELLYPCINLATHHVWVGCVSFSWLNSLPLEGAYYSHVVHPSY
jgi:hypothetical protein